jgi:hypothetical protein
LGEKAGAKYVIHHVLNELRGDVPGEVAKVYRVLTELCQARSAIIKGLSVDQQVDGLYKLLATTH